MRFSLRVRAVANALNLSTASGLLLAALTRTSIEAGPEGLIFGTHYRPRLPHAGAFTVGNVIFYRADRDFIDSRPDLLAHEAGHATQYAWCLGLPFLPLYAACAAWSLWRTGDPGSRNFFERNAGLALGGYRELPTIARLPVIRNYLQQGAFLKKPRLTRSSEGNQP
ncbi:DUF4157 domain-containing protein [Arthrobacter psychrolactophilus]|uniref:DUF4157 domain-containing protein n=1 Tax=Arthrobacter psychrolactophilus TaxID=92442 RepID=UPI001FE9C71A|nr:DUF4157 domain-containing protein [Arthrobacter psychrolactophilus]